MSKKKSKSSKIKVTKPDKGREKIKYLSLNKREKCGWFFLTLLLFLESIHYASSNYPSMLYSKLKDSKNVVGVEIFNFLGSGGRVLIHFVTLVALLSFIYLFRVYGRVFKSKIVVYSYFLIAFIWYLSFLLYYFILSESSSSFVVMLTIFLLIAFLSLFRVKTVFSHLKNIPINKEVILTSSLSLILVSGLTLGESLSVSNFEKNIISKTGVNSLNSLLGEFKTHSYKYSYSYFDPASGGAGNHMEGVFNGKSCEEEGWRYDKITQKVPATKLAESTSVDPSEGPSTIESATPKETTSPEESTSQSVITKSYWINHDNIYYSNYANLGYIRDDSRINHIGSTMIGLLVTGATSEANAWGVCEDILHLGNIAKISSNTININGSGEVKVKYEKLLVEKATKNRTWSWVGDLGYKGVAKIYTYEANLPSYGSFIESLDNLTFTFNKGELTSISTYGIANGVSVKIEELTLSPTTDYSSSLPKNIKNISKSFKEGV